MQRLIDADALKESIDEHVYLVHHGFNETEYGCTQYGIHQIIDEQPIVDAEPHWIPCSERFPEKDGYYLTTTCYRQVYCDFWNEDHFDRTEMVIAWMPLPKPYEVEE